MALEPHVLQGYIRKLYRFLKQGHIIQFRKMRLYEGEVNTVEYPTVVILDPRRNILSTFIHEFIHYVHSEWSESKVIEMESLIVNALSERQTKNIIRRLADAL